MLTENHGKEPSKGITMENSTIENDIWFYEQNGERKGGVTETDLITLIKNGTLRHGSSVWKKGFPNWTNIEDTQLREHLDDTTPPPLTGAKVNNTVVWILAFAPLIGLTLEYFVAYLVHSSEYRAERAVANEHFIYITLILNIALSFLDEKKLKKSGTDTSPFSGWVWLVPVYLYQRAQTLKQNLAYFIVWIVCFLLIVIGA